MSGLGAKNPSGSVGLGLGQPATMSEAVIRWAVIGLTTRRLELRILAPPPPNILLRCAGLVSVGGCQ